ncbi:Vitamin H transporter 1 [Ceratocystis platani]|uniref:Vitamin H transporter 1 n=1 Tax=Ceratocystis fimbriata f. sp. platani TaxID=88771 RepID=A0A0F8D473_CERFI|nr:Vitamin H transporter 1 [Ceratocystis platani]
MSLSIRGPQADPEPAAKPAPLVSADHAKSLPTVEYSTEEAERMYRRLDWRIIPAFWALFFLCSGIRSNIGVAQTMNRKEGHDLMSELELTSKDTSTALALFYIAYTIFDVPSNLVMTRFSPRVWMARIVTATGIIGTCFAAVQDAWSLKLLRFLLGAVIAGMWSGMAFYLTMFYPPSHSGKRIGMYYTAAQASAAVVGLVSAGFQKMDGIGGLAGFQWMFLLWGFVTTAVGVSLLWWLPDRPLVPGQARLRKGFVRFIPATPEALTGRDAQIHYQDLRRVYHTRRWKLHDLGRVLIDWRLWPLMLMYFGVVGVGIGTQLYGSVMIASIQPSASTIVVSLLVAPIWIIDLCSILLVVPLSDRYRQYRPFFFVGGACIQIAGLLTTTFAMENGWARYSGLLMVGFGLGPTIPICMAWTTQIFQKRHGDIGVAAATAVVSGLGNLGSITTTYGLYTGWDDDAKPGPYRFRKSNLAMVGILCMSILSSLVMFVLLRVFGAPPIQELNADIADDAEAEAEITCKSQRSPSDMASSDQEKKSGLSEAVLVRQERA